tara:strand:- start:382 stop:708 length:327 start_codon:yes stop_codon:yes gene_type:complete
MNKARKYDMKMAYDKNLKPSARLHYLENERHDAPGKMMKSPMKKESAAQEKKDLMMDMPVDERAAAKMMKSPNKMAGESPMKMGGSWMSKHSGLKMMKPSPTKLYKKK